MGIQSFNQSLGIQNLPRNGMPNFKGWPEVNRGRKWETVSREEGQRVQREQCMRKLLVVPGAWTVMGNEGGKVRSWV